MSGTWLGINIASSGLLVNQKALEIIGNNVANAGTPGFKRQRVVIAEGNPSGGVYASGSTSHSAIGTGARIEAIQRMQDEFLEQRLRAAHSNTGNWQALDQRLSGIETVFGEPSDSAIQDTLNRFWNAWHDLSANPESVELRANLLGQASTLSARIRELYQSINDSRDDIDFEITNLVGEINRAGQEIAEIDNQVAAASGFKESPNALLDRRDLLVAELSKLLDVTQYGQQGSDYVVGIGGKPLVFSTNFTAMKVTTNADGHAAIVWADDDTPVSITNGKIEGLLTVRDKIIPDYLTRLDNIATGLVQQINAIHKTGYGLDGSTGLDFFVDGSTAVNIAVNPALLASVKSVAASAAGGPGDGSLAYQIAQLRDPINKEYAMLVSQLGADASIAKQQGEAHNLISQQLTIQQESVSGVSLDEEMADMIRYQHSYNAMARVMTAVDEMIGTIVEKVGVVGR